MRLLLLIIAILLVAGCAKDKLMSESPAVCSVDESNLSVIAVTGLDWKTQFVYSQGYDFRYPPELVANENVYDYEEDCPARICSDVIFQNKSYSIESKTFRNISPESFHEWLFANSAGCGNYTGGFGRLYNVTSYILNGSEALEFDNLARVPAGDIIGRVLEHHVSVLKGTSVIDIECDTMFSGKPCASSTVQVLRAMAASARVGNITYIGDDWASAEFRGINISYPGEWYLDYTDQGIAINGWGPNRSDVAFELDGEVTAIGDYFQVQDSQDLFNGEAIARRKVQNRYLFESGDRIRGDRVEILTAGKWGRALFADYCAESDPYSGIYMYAANESGSLLVLHFWARKGNGCAETNRILDYYLPVMREIMLRIA